MCLLYDIKNKFIQEFVNKIAGIAGQGASSIKIGSTVQPVVHVQTGKLIAKELHNQSTSADLWVISADKRIRLMGAVITVTKEATCAGAQFIYLQSKIDGISQVCAIVGMSAAALTAPGVVTVAPFDFSYSGGLLFDKGEKLTLVSNGAFTAGGMTASVWGYEE